MSNIKYKYRFINLQLKQQIYEIEYTNLPYDAPKKDKFQWFLKTNSSEEPLDFISIKEDKRIFKQGYLHIFKDYAIFNGNKFDLF